MKVLESKPFSSSEDFKVRVRELKLAGMRELGIPESLADCTQMSFDSLELRSVGSSGSKKVNAGSMEEMESFIKMHADEFVLSVRI